MEDGDPAEKLEKSLSGQQQPAFREVFCLFGEGILAPDRCKKTLELFAEKGIPCFR